MSILATCASIAATIASAHGGDAITLTGDCPAIAIKRRSFEPRIGIDASAAKVAGVTIEASTGIEWTGGTITAGPKGYSVHVLRSSRVTVKAVTATQAVRGIVADTSTDLLFSSNILTGLRTDGVDLANSQRVTVAFNQCRAFTPAPLDHPDCIQAWAVAGQPPVSDILIVGNSADGDMQGIGFYDGPYERVSIIGNRARITYGNAVAISEATDVLVTMNDVAGIVRADGKRVKGNINIRDSERATVCGNVVQDVPKNLAARPC